MFHYPLPFPFLVDPHQQFPQFEYSSITHRHRLSPFDFIETFTLDILPRSPRILWGVHNLSFHLAMQPSSYSLGTAYPLPIRRPYITLQPFFSRDLNFFSLLLRHYAATFTRVTFNPYIYFIWVLCNPWPRFWVLCNPRPHLGTM
jgi:hypothetical protein